MGVVVFPMVYVGCARPVLARAERSAVCGAVSQGAGAWPAVGTAPTLTDLSCERAARLAQILTLANLTARGLLLHVASQRDTQWRYRIPLQPLINNL